MNTAQLSCPHCHHNQETEIPQNKCLAFFKCDQCEKVIDVPLGSQNCCVICEFSDKNCPMGGVS